MKVRNSYLDQLESELRNEMRPTKSEAKVEKEPTLFAEKSSKVSKKKGQKKFSDWFGFVPPSGIDHIITGYKDTDWEEDLRVHIPDIKEFANYEPQQHEVELMVLGAEMGDRVNIVGPTGSGKSSMVKYVCAILRIPFVRINGRGDLESSGLLGQLTAQNGSTVWQDGLVTFAVRNGAWLCLDEWTLIPPEILMTLQYLMEDGGKLIVTDMPGSATDKTITPHKSFRLICTDNTRGLGDETGAFAATNVQNTATLDRFGTVIHLDYLNSEHESNVLKNSYPELTDDLSKKMIQFASLVRQAYDTNELSLTCSPRTLLNWAKKALYFRDPAIALRMSFFEKISGDAERQAVSGFYRTVFNQDLV
jgi:cobaltochelatase CobS